jgi:hypothetical protein
LLHLISITPEENARLENSMQRPVVPPQDFPHFSITQKLPEGAQEKSMKKQENQLDNQHFYPSTPSTIKRGNGKSSLYRFSHWNLHLVWGFSSHIPG